MWILLEFRKKFLSLEKTLSLDNLEFSENRWKKACVNAVGLKRCASYRKVRNWTVEYLMFKINRVGSYGTAHMASAWLEGTLPGKACNTAFPWPAQGPWLDWRWSSTQRWQGKSGRITGSSHGNPQVWFDCWKRIVEKSFKITLFWEYKMKSNRN